MLLNSENILELFYNTFILFDMIWIFKVFTNISLFLATFDFSFEKLNRNDLNFEKRVIRINSINKPFNGIFSS